MRNIRTIEVGVDFSACSDAAISQALRIARWGRARVHIMHVLESLAVADLGEVLYAPVQAFNEEVRIEAKKRLDALVEGIRSSQHPIAGVDVDDVEISTDVLVGSPAVDLIHQVREQATDLLILGAHSQLSRHHRAGVVATKCVRKAPCRVMLVRESHDKPFKTVVCCVDFSETSQRALEQAVSLAAQDDARLYVVHVHSPPWGYTEFTVAPALRSPEYQQEYEAELTERMRAFLRPVEVELKALKAQERLVQHANHAAGIVAFLEEHGADIVVLGTRGRTGWKRFLMGTTAERIIHDSPCSVLAVKPHDHAADDKR